MDAATKIEYAKIQAVKTEPFYGSVAMQLAWKRDDNIPTMATNGKYIAWNGSFVDDLKVEELIYVICHECQHVIKLHQLRIGERDPMIWNMACDININNELDRCFCSKRTPPGGKNQGIHMPEYGDMLEEHIYDDLMQKGGEQLKKLLEGFKNIGEIIKSNDTKEARSEIASIIKTSSAIAKSAGKLPGGLSGYSFSEEKPKVNWIQQLLRYVEPIKESHLSMRRLNKRVLHMGMNIPSPIKDGTGEIVIGIDTSGSISHREISQWFAEMKFIFDKVKPSKYHCIYFHSNVWKYISGASNNFKVPSKIETGGTSFQSVWNFISEKKIKPRCLIMLTDMGDSFPNKPNYDVIWCATSDIVGPYGKTVRVEI